MRTADNGLLGGCEGTGIDIFHSAAKIADEVMMMAAKGVRQLVAGKSLLELQATDDTQIAEQLDRAVDRHPVDRTVTEATVNLFDAERCLPRQEHVRNGPPGLGQPIASFFEQGVYAIRRNGDSHISPS